LLAFCNLPVVVVCVFLSQNYVNSEICCFMLVQTKVMFVFPNFITQTLGLVSNALPFESNTDVVMM